MTNLKLYALQPFGSWYYFFIQFACWALALLIWGCGMQSTSLCVNIYTGYGLINILGYIYSIYWQHLHSWCLQRSTQTSGGEQWCLLQASEEQPLETPCNVTTCSPSDGCSPSRGTERPLNLTSRKQPGGAREREGVTLKKEQLTMPKDTLKHQSSGQDLLWSTFTPWQGCKVR